jgi:thiamine biosynthesis protein ThiS
MKTTVKINGEEREVDESATLAELLATLSINPKGIAVELNREVIPKSLHNKTTIKKNDQIEIIRMTGGG